MANTEHLRRLEASPEEWNAWRHENSGVKPDLSDANLAGRWFPSNMNFRETNFSGSDLSEASFPSADFYSATLTGANLSRIDAVHCSFHRCNADGANFAGAGLSNADFQSANLSRANFAGAHMSSAKLWSASMLDANLTDADLSWCDLMDADLSAATLHRTNLNVANLLRTRLLGARLVECCIHGASVWRVEIDDTTQQVDLIVSDPSEPEFRVSDIEVAQFIYLLINHRKLRNAIDSITKKGVLLLGRFSDGGLDMLKVVASELRAIGYLPYMFDFQSPKDRNLTETIKTLVGLSRFVVVDLSGPSVPQELYATVPHFKIPFVPILESTRRAYAMSSDILEYPWVVNPVFQFSSVEQLRLNVLERIVTPAEKLVVERASRLARV